MLTGADYGILEGGAGIDTLELDPLQGFRLDGFFEDGIYLIEEDGLTTPSSDFYHWSGWTIELTNPAQRPTDPENYTSTSTLANAVGHVGEQSPSTADQTNYNYVYDVENILGSFIGDTGDDVLIGGAGSDNLSGGAGDDLLIGLGFGATADAGDVDTLEGGAGSDTFRIGTDDFDQFETAEALREDGVAPTTPAETVGQVVLVDFDPSEDILSFVGSDVTEADISCVFVPDAPAAIAAFSAAASDPSGKVEVFAKGQLVAPLQNTSQSQVAGIKAQFGVDVVDDTIALDLAVTDTLPDILANDTPSSGGTALSITAINGETEAGPYPQKIDLTSGASLEVGAGGALRFIDNGAYPGAGGTTITEQFSYEATDDAGSFQTGLVTLNVDLPVLSDGIVSGTDQNDVIMLGYTDPDGDSVDDQDNRIEASAGNDIVSGAGGADVLNGGTGSDYFFGVGPGDEIDDRLGDVDILALQVWSGGLRVTPAPNDPEAGLVEYFDQNGDPAGTLTFKNIEALIPCFTPGSLIVADKGLRSVEEISVGDTCLTRDRGFQKVRWVGARNLAPERRDRFAPVEIAQNAIAPGVPDRAMRVSPQHRVLITGAPVELHTGQSEALVPAVQLVGQPGIRRVLAEETTYIHRAFDHHELPLVDGFWSESFLPGPASVKCYDPEVQRELLALFPNIFAAQPEAACRITTKTFEAQVVLGH